MKDIELDNIGYQKSNNLGIPKGANPNLINQGQATTSLVNKLHLIKLSNDFPYKDNDYNGDSRFQPKTFVDLCKMDFGACQYDADDFLYCKNIGFPINHLITLRRFPYPCTDNIYDQYAQGEPDIARMITYFSQDINKLDELLSFSYGMRWKELTSEMEQASMQGDQSGFSGFMKKTMSIIDPTLAGNTLSGDNKLNYDPKHDQNKVYGPVDSINSTHIRDVGFEFNKEFEISFEYELRSIGGRTPEYAMKDVLANILACTHNNGKFWPGSRYWVGERPSQFIDKLKFMNPDSVDEFLFGAHSALKNAIAGFSSSGTALQTLKNIMTNGFAMAMGKLLDKLGRPSIIVMNSLLSAEPTGFWHLTIGNPDNPMMCIGNLILTGVDISFPTDNLSYGDFPTKLLAKVKLKPGQPKDKAGIEMMFNMGKRIYYNPKTVSVESNKSKVAKEARSFFGFNNDAVNRTLEQSFDFVSDKVQIVSSTVKNSETVNNLIDNIPITVNANSIFSNSNKSDLNIK